MPSSKPTQEDTPVDDVRQAYDDWAARILPDLDDDDIDGANRVAEHGLSQWERWTVPQAEAIVRAVRAREDTQGQRSVEDRSEPPPGCIPHRTEAVWVEHAWDAATLAVAWREYDSLRDRIRTEARAEWEAEREAYKDDLAVKFDLYVGAIFSAMSAETGLPKFDSAPMMARHFREAIARARDNGRAEGALEKEREIIARIDVPGELCNEPGFVIAQALRTDSIRRDDTGRHTTEGSDDDVT